MMKENNKKETPLLIKTSFFIYDEPNRNGRIYSEQVCEQMVDQFNNLRKTYPVYGELNPNYNDSNIINAKISHEIEEIHINKNNKSLDGTIRVLDTHDGKLLKEILTSDNPLPLSIASRGFGDTDSSGNILNYKLTSFDIIPTNLCSNKLILTINKENSSLSLSDL